jgi:hypothetical protein
MAGPGITLQALVQREYVCAGSSTAMSFSFEEASHYIHNPDEHTAIHTLQRVDEDVFYSKNIVHVRQSRLYKRQKLQNQYYIYHSDYKRLLCPDHTALYLCLDNTTHFAQRDSHMDSIHTSCRSMCYNYADPLLCMYPTLLVYSAHNNTVKGMCLIPMVMKLRRILHVHYLTMRKLRMLDLDFQPRLPRIWSSRMMHKESNMKKKHILF